MGVALDLTGSRVEHLVVLGPAGRRGHERYWHVQCDCGTTKQVATTNLRRQKSCGCIKVGSRRGASNHPLYGTWNGMRHRCGTPGHTGYANYGGRGISIHPAWREDFWMFAAWIRDNLGERPEGCTLDRVDNDGNYEPGNLRWASRWEQSANQRAVVSNHRYDAMCAERNLWRERALALGWQATDAEA